jgi:hypothetical protein
MRGYINMDPREKGLKVWIGLISLRMGSVAESCEHGNEHSGSIKGGEFLDNLSVLLAPQGGLFS